MSSDNYYVVLPYRGGFTPVMQFMSDDYYRTPKSGCRVYDTPEEALAAVEHEAVEYASYISAECMKFGEVIPICEEPVTVKWSRHENKTSWQERITPLLREGARVRCEIGTKGIMTVTGPLDTSSGFIRAGGVHVAYSKGNLPAPNLYSIEFLEIV